MNENAWRCQNRTELNTTPLSIFAENSYIFIIHRNESSCEFRCDCVALVAANLCSDSFRMSFSMCLFLVSFCKVFGMRSA